MTSRFLEKRRAAGKESSNWKGWWLLYLLVLLPAAVFLAYNSVFVDAWSDLQFLAGFLVVSIGGGVLIGRVKVRGQDQWFFPGLVAAYVAAVFAALCIAALNVPTLPLVEGRA